MPMRLAPAPAAAAAAAMLLAVLAACGPQSGEAKKGEDRPAAAPFGFELAASQQAEPVAPPQARSAR
jgi:hypothetical protein